MPAGTRRSVFTVVATTAGINNPQRTATLVIVPFDRPVKQQEA
jgi:hypothetical protein